MPWPSPDLIRGLIRGLTRPSRPCLPGERRGEALSPKIVYNPLKGLDSRKEKGLVFVPNNLEFVPPGLEFIPPGLDFVPRGLEFLQCGREGRPRSRPFGPAGDRCLGERFVTPKGEALGVWRSDLTDARMELARDGINAP